MRIFDLTELNFLLPEIVLLSGTLLILLIDLFLPKNYKIATYYLTIIVLIASLVVTTNFIGTQKLILFDSFIVDGFATWLKIFSLGLTVILVAYTKEYLYLKGTYNTENLLLILFSTLGVMIMLSGASTLILYLGLEILSLSLYSLIAINKTHKTTIEAGLKYFILGAIASGILLYGISLLYGASSSLLISDIVTVSFEDNKMLISFALVFIIIGIAFKLGAVPFHNWVPDVYQGASLAATMLLSSVPKIAYLALIYRILEQSLDFAVDYWSDLLLILGIASIVIGTLVALVQKSMKRLLAYSTIANIGFVLIAFSIGIESSYSTGIFYTVVYAISAIVLFGVLIIFSTKDYEINDIADLSGLGKYSASYAFMLLILLFSMAGVPPFIGFWTKLAIIDEIVRYEIGGIYIAVFMVVFAVIAAYYYLQVIRVIYFEKANKKLIITSNKGVKLLLFFSVLGIVLVGIWPNYMLDIIKNLF